MNQDPIKNSERVFVIVFAILAGALIGLGLAFGGY